MLSKHPIKRVDYLLLSRQPADAADDHQRLCMHALVDAPLEEGGPVDVYVVHLALSEPARERAVLEIWEYVRRGTAATQVLMGDLNAEPDSLAMQFLRGEAELQGRRTDLRDAWLAAGHGEPAPGCVDPDVRHRAFTFPSDNPSKRIDFVLVRSSSAPGGANAPPPRAPPTVVRAELLGQEPAPWRHAAPAAGFTGGMQEPHSPLWASDHRALAVDLQFPL